MKSSETSRQTGLVGPCSAASATATHVKFVAALDDNADNLHGQSSVSQCYDYNGKRGYEYYRRFLTRQIRTFRVVFIVVYTLADVFQSS
jgi:hypothetical protein